MLSKAETVRAYILDRIDDDRWTEGYRLPSTSKIAAIVKCHHSTVADEINRLIGSGVLMRPEGYRRRPEVARRPKGVRSRPVGG